MPDASKTSGSVRPGSPERAEPSEAKRVLLVDDEASVLAGLRNLFRRHRSKWTTVAALGGEEAMRELENGPFDVIISDMRMPRVDGAAVLRYAQAAHPETVRIVLSGYTELEAALRAVPVAHQFLTKPCNPETLANVVERACGLQTLIQDRDLRQLVGKIEKLPSLPRTYARLTQLLADENSGVAEVAQVIEQDMAMCAKLLQLVNSAFFGLGKRVTRIEQAVVFLGLSMVKNLVLTVEVFDGASRAKVPGFSYAGLEQHARLTAMIASGIMEGNKRLAEDAFVAGILHDIGKLVLAAELPELFQQVVAESTARKISFHAAERALGPVTHAELGAYLLGLWGLPYPILEATAHHLRPAEVAQVEVDTLTAVYAANVLAHEQEARVGLDLHGEPLDMDYLASLGVADRLPAWRALAERCMNDLVGEHAPGSTP